MEFNRHKARTTHTPEPGKQSERGHHHKSQMKQKNRSQLPTINPEHHGDLQNIYKDIISLNRDYLTNKLKVGEVKRPNQYQHKLPSKTGKSEYSYRYKTNASNATFDWSTAQIEPSRTRIQLPKHQVTNMKSSYELDYKPEKYIQPNTTINAYKPKGSKFFIDTDVTPLKKSSYQKDYSDRGFEPSEVAKRLESFFLGGKFKDDTTYKNSYDHKLKLKTQPTEPIVQRQHKIFVGVDSPSQSRYQQNFLKNSASIELPIRPSNHLTPSFQKMIQKSTYNSQFAPKAHSKEEEFLCMNNEQLDTFIFNN